MKYLLMERVGFPNGKSRTFDATQATQCAKLWRENTTTRREIGAWILRVINDDGEISQGTHEQVKPVIDAAQKLRSDS